MKKELGGGRIDPEFRMERDPVAVCCEYDVQAGYAFEASL
jgi:hypothetical protein